LGGIGEILQHHIQIEDWRGDRANRRRNRGSGRHPWAPRIILAVDRRDLGSLAFIFIPFIIIDLLLLKLLNKKVH
jgi:hypothetical protein